jgi:hypothetical protein
VNGIPPGSIGEKDTDPFDVNSSKMVHNSWLQLWGNALRCLAAADGAIRRLTAVLARAVRKVERPSDMAGSQRVARRCAR